MISSIVQQSRFNTSSEKLSVHQLEIEVLLLPALKQSSESFPSEYLPNLKIFRAVKQPRS
jgi:hypothetical protein